MPTRPLFWSVRLTGGPVSLCNACLSVLVQEGSLAGDPREDAIPAADVLRITPLTLGKQECDNCESLRRYELHRPALQAPPALLATLDALTARELEGDDATRFPSMDSYGLDANGREMTPRHCPERCDADACRNGCAG